MNGLMDGVPIKKFVLFLIPTSCQILLKPICRLNGCKHSLISINEIIKSPVVVLRN